MTTIDHTAGLAVETRGLTQTFGSTNALESVDLTVRPAPSPDSSAATAPGSPPWCP